MQQTLATLDEPTIVTGALPELDAGLWFGELVKSLGDRLTQFQVLEAWRSHIPLGLAVPRKRIEEHLPFCPSGARA